MDLRGIGSHRIINICYRFQRVIIHLYHIQRIHRLLAGFGYHHCYQIACMADNFACHWRFCGARYFAAIPVFRIKQAVNFPDIIGIQICLTGGQNYPVTAARSRKVEMGDTGMSKRRTQKSNRPSLSRHLVIGKRPFPCQKVSIFQAFDGLTNSKFHFIFLLFYTLPVLSYQGQERIYPIIN